MSFNIRRVPGPYNYFANDETQARMGRRSVSILEALSIRELIMIVISNNQDPRIDAAKEELRKRPTEDVYGEQEQLFLELTEEPNDDKNLMVTKLIFDIRGLHVPDPAADPKWREQFRRKIEMAGS